MIEKLYLRNTSTNQTILFDRDWSEYLLESVDLGSVEGNHHSYKYINQVGVYIDSTSLEQRTVSISGWIIGDSYSTLQINKSRLNRLINPIDTIEITIYDKYKLSFKPDYSIKYSSSYKENNEVLCKFIIQGTCADPMFTTVAPTGVLIASTLGKFKFPLVIPEDPGLIMGVRQPIRLAQIYNEGDIPSGMVITFRAKGTVENPSLYSVLTQETIKINKTLDSGEEVIMSTTPGSKYIKGRISGVEENYFKYLDLESSWLQLAVGDNAIQYDADSGVENLEVFVSYETKYLEVQ